MCHYITFTVLVEQDRLWVEEGGVKTNNSITLS